MSATVSTEDAELGSMRKLWLTLATLGVVVSLNVIDVTQGGAVSISVKSAFGVDFSKDVPEAVGALWGVIFLTTFVGSAALVLGAHAERVPGGWFDRYAFRLFQFPTNDGVGRVVQIVAFVVLTLAPAYVLGHSWKVMLAHGVLCSEVVEADWRDAGRGASAFFGGSDPAKPVAVRMTSNERVGKTADDQAVGWDVCRKEGQTSYWVPWQSWIMAMLSLLAFGALARALRSLFRRRPSQTMP